MNINSIWQKEDVGICYEYTHNQFIYDQWLLNIKAFNVLGYERNTSEDEAENESVKKINSLSDLPDSHEFIVLSPQNGREIQGDKNIREFDHPKKCIYYFGSDDDFMKTDELKNVEYQTIYVPINENLWSPQIASIVLYDRLMKSWQ